MALLIVILKKQRFDKSLIISSLCHEVASVRRSGIIETETETGESSQSSVEEFSSSSINSRHVQTMDTRLSTYWALV